MNWLQVEAAPQSDPMQLNDIGFSFKIRANLRNAIYDDGVLSTGFHIFIDDIPEQTRVPVHVPADMDVQIMLAEARKVQEKTRCRTEMNPNFPFFGFDDPYGMHCRQELTVKTTLENYGCMIPISTYSPINESCSFEQAFFLSSIMGKGGIDFEFFQRTESDPVSLYDALSKTQPTQRVLTF